MPCQGSLAPEARAACLPGAPPAPSQLRHRQLLLVPHLQRRSTRLRCCWSRCGPSWSQPIARQAASSEPGSLLGVASDLLRLGINRMRAAGAAPQGSSRACGRLGVVPMPCQPDKRSYSCHLLLLPRPRAQGVVRVSNYRAGTMVNRFHAGVPLHLPGCARLRLPGCGSAARLAPLACRLLRVSSRWLEARGHAAACCLS